jgi:general secretion pathway protein I
MTQRGFTLLEVLIAFVIAALAIGSLLHGAAGGIQNTAVASHYQEALSRARSRLAEAALAPVIGEQHGDDGGGFRWQTVVQVQAVARPPRKDIDPVLIGRPVLYGVRVAIRWSMDGGARTVVLSTRRLGDAPPDDAAPP